MTQLEQSYLDKEWIDACPTGVLALDDAGAIHWVNPALESLLGMPASQLLGCTRETAPSLAREMLFDDEEVARFQDLDTGERWFRRDETSIPISGEQYLTLCFFQDISNQILLQVECNRLRKQVKELTLTDALTGLANQRALINALTNQVTRSRRYQNPLALVLVRVDLGDEKTRVIADIPDQAVLAVSHYLRDRLRWADVIGRYDHDLFMLILPETDSRSAKTLVEKIRDQSSEIELPEELKSLPLNLAFGMAEWQRGDDPRLLIERATDTMLTSLPAVNNLCSR